MALTYSSMLELGTKIPHFELKNVLDDEIYSSSSLSNGKPSLIMVICNHCPYVIHYHEELKRMNNDFGDSINFLAISSNDIVNYPQDGPDQMKELFLNLGLSFPYLFDETQEIAHKFGAKRTPEFFLFNSEGRLTYSGRMDDSPRDPNQVTTKELQDAIDSLLNGEEPKITFTESIGCSVKWKM